MVFQKRTIVAMQHANRDGSPKILPECTLPLTGKRCTDTIVSEMGVIRITETGLKLIEHAADVTPEDVAQATGAPLDIEGSVPMQV